jgi:hypothetical protein
MNTASARMPAQSGTRSRLIGTFGPLVVISMRVVHPD